MWWPWKPRAGQVQAPGAKPIRAQEGPPPPPAPRPGSDKRQREQRKAWLLARWRDLP